MAAFANMTTNPAVDFCFGLIFAYAASTMQVMVASVGKGGNGERLSGRRIRELSKVPSGSSLSCRIAVLLYRRPHVLVHRRYKATPLRYLKCRLEGFKENLDNVDTVKPMSG